VPGIVTVKTDVKVGEFAKFDAGLHQPGGTKGSTSGSWRSTRDAAPVRWRLIGFITALLLGALLIAWINTVTWQRVFQLEQDFATVRAERFYHSIHLRSAIRQLNDILFRFHLKGQPEDLEQFSVTADRLQHWLAARTREAASSEERALFLDLNASYAAYLRETDGLQKRRTFGSARKQLDEVNERLRDNAAAFLDLTDQLMDVQRRSFAGFLSQSQHTLDSFQRLMKLSLFLLMALAVSVVALVYRGMIAPLRAQLSASHAAIVRQEKLAALGGLAAGVAHEIRNPLTAIKFRLFSLKRSLPDALGDNEDANVIDSEIHRLERIVKDFLQFARPSDPDWTLVPAARIFEEVHSLLEAPLERVSIELKLDVPVPVWLHADPQQIKQVLINLVQNAAESIGHDGVVTLRAAPGHASLGGVRRPVTVLDVADTGAGISPEVQKRLFDPFFTTKDGGTGLGLPIAARIVEKHGGELRYETQIHRGTTFQLVLPRVPEE
jgi:signal transduction histidine kinase